MKQDDLRIKKDPNIIKHKLGHLDAEITLTVPENLKATTNAMISICQAEVRDDELRKKGTDDYILSLEKVLSALDTFLREKKKCKGGTKECYDFNSPIDCTLYLLWQIRHVFQHHGGIIDEECQRKYQLTMDEMIKKGLTSIIYMPQKLEIGQALQFSFEDYKKIKEAFFTFIEKDIGKKDTDILRLRSSLKSLEIEKVRITINLENYSFTMDLIEAINFGFTFDLNKKQYLAPHNHLKCFPDRRQIIDLATGEVLTVEVKPKVEGQGEVVWDIKRKIEK